MQYLPKTASLLGLATVAALGLAAANPALAFNYNVTDLGSLGGDVSGAFAINNLGQLVGSSQTIPGGSTVANAFLYSSGTLADLGTLAGGSGTSTAQGINDSGQIVGYSDNGPHAFFYSNGTMNDLGTLGGAASYGLGIDSAGRSVGYSLTSAGVYHAFATTAGETAMTAADDIGTLGGANSLATAISPTTVQVVGFSQPAGSASFHAFIYSNGSFTDLGTLPGGSSSLAYGANDSGQVVGNATDSGGSSHAFLYSAGTGMIDLGTLGGSTSMAQGINKYGEVVGDSKTAGNAATAGFLYSSGQMTDLNTRLFTPGFTVIDAYAINDQGQIAAIGLHNGLTRALLLDPAFAAAPEPSAALALALGALLAGGLVFKAKRRAM